MQKQFNERLAAAAFGFITTGVLAGAIIVAVASVAPAQDSIRYPTDRGGVANNGGNVPQQNSWGSLDGTPSGTYWGARANPNSAVQQGIPSTIPTAPANTLMQGGKK